MGKTIRIAELSKKEVDKILRTKKLAPRCFKWVKLDLLIAKMIVDYAL